MASISRFPLVSHLRAEPNEYVMHYRDGKLVRSGAGLAYWFNPLAAAIAQLRLDDCETTFVLNERSNDFQEVTVQCTLTYRFSDPQRAAARVNFTLSLHNGAWKEQPLERLANLWAQKAQQPARAYLATVPIAEAMRSGAEIIRRDIEAALRNDPEIADMGLTLVSVLVSRISPTSEVEKALQTPTRESIQQKADEAVFQRRAMAVEKERAIKENEQATLIELSRREEQLIRHQAANRLLEARSAAEAEKERIAAEAERDRIMAEAYAANVATRAAGDAEAQRRRQLASAEAESARVLLWSEAPPHVALGFAAQTFAEKLKTIQHLNVTPDLVSAALTKLLRDTATGK